ncbi:MAG: hypothetical protein ACRDCT_21475 [Shewanella sp.]
MKDKLEALEQRIKAVAGPAKVMALPDGKIEVRVDWCPVSIKVKPSTRPTIKGWVNGTYKKFITAYFKNKEVQGYMAQARGTTFYTGPLFDSESAPF